MQRKTEQNKAIREVFSKSARPLSVQEVFELTKELIPSIGLATIYRNLKALVKSGWLQPVQLPGESDRYEIASSEHHHHFCCTKCNKIFDILDCPDNIERLVPEGFLLEKHDITLYGLCRECREKDQS